MVFRAYSSIEEQLDGRWICRRTTIVAGRYGPVEVQAGQVFVPKTTFAGYDDFTGHLAAVAIDGPSVPPHAWS
ncbi:MAG TPA: hypothetical protein VNR39_06310 [Pseudolabrys sp.]|nr:hypothetical protein [Pseudolabrys sp.]